MPSATRASDTGVPVRSSVNERGVYDDMSVNERGMYDDMEAAEEDGSAEEDDMKWAIL